MIDDITEIEIDDDVDEVINVSDDSFEKAMAELDFQDDARKYND